MKKFKDAVRRNMTKRQYRDLGGNENKFKNAVARNQKARDFRRLVEEDPESALHELFKDFHDGD